MNLRPLYTFSRSLSAGCLQRAQQLAQVGIPLAERVLLPHILDITKDLYAGLSWGGAARQVCGGCSFSHGCTPSSGTCCPANQLVPCPTSIMAGMHASFAFHVLQHGDGQISRRPGGVWRIWFACQAGGCLAGPAAWPLCYSHTGAAHSVVFKACAVKACRQLYAARVVSELAELLHCCRRSWQQSCACWPRPGWSTLSRRCHA